MPRRNRSAVLCCLASSLASPAFAKGGPGADQASQTPDGLYATTSPARQLARRGRLRCPVTAADCTDVDFRFSACGRAELSRIEDATPSATPTTCEVVCAELSPTDAECRDQLWYNSICGLLERRRMGLESTFGTVPTLQESEPPVALASCTQSLVAEALLPGLGFADEAVEQVRVPDLNCAPSDCQSTSGDRTLARQPSFDRDDQTILPMQSLYYGMMTEDFTELSKSEGETSSYKVDFFDFFRLEWEINGNDIGKLSEEPGAPEARLSHGCYEYIYEKYYDWARFTDALASRGSDVRAAWEIAFATSPELERSNIGRRALDGIPLSTRSGTPTDPQLHFPPGDSLQPKSLYHAFTYLRNDGSGDFNGYELSDLLNSPDGTPKIRLKDQQLLENMVSLVLSDPGHVEDWQYHFEQGDALLDDYLDSEFAFYDRFVEEFRQLLERRFEITRAIAAVILVSPEQLVETLVNQQIDLSVYGQALEQVVTPQARALSVAKAYAGDLDNGLIASDAPFLGAVAARTFETDSAEQGFTTYSNPNPVGGPGQPGQRMGGISNLAARTSGGLSAFQAVNNAALQVAMFAQYGDLSNVTLDDLERLWDALEFMDGEIEAHLLEAFSEEVGCLDMTDRFSPTPCDWSPRRFRSLMQDPYIATREVDFQHCRDRTDVMDRQLIEMDQLEELTFIHPEYGGCDAFTQGPNVGFCVTDVDGENCIDDFRDDGVEGLERYFECRDQWLIDYQLGLEALLNEPLFNPETGQVEVGKQASDSFELGGRMFGIEFDYAGSWGLGGNSIPLPGPDTSYCDLDAGLSGNVGVIGKAFYQEVSLLDGGVDLSTSDQTGSQIYLEVFGQEIFGEDDIDLSVDTSYGGSDQAVQTFFKYEAVVVIVWIPVSLEAGIRGGLGISGSASGQTQNCASGSLGVVGVLTPFAFVDGYAEAAVDAVVVEAGVTGVLQLISLQLPFQVGMTFAGSTSQTGDKKSRMDVEAGFDLTMTLLSGYFAAYVEICYGLIVGCERAEAKIFSWDGPSVTVPLYRFDFGVDLEPLAILQAQGPGGN